ncbi:hypothetical protein AF71_00061010 [Rhizobium sp. 57MFTsu3.2]|nr:hypothetical protein [Rhizobium sp. 57MFTsu3.2]
MRCAHGATFSPIDKLPARNAAGFFYGISGVLRVNLIIGRLLSCSGDPEYDLCFNGCRKECGLGLFLCHRTADRSRAGFQC